MQPAFAQGRAPHDLAVQIDNAERLDALRRHPSAPSSHHSASEPIFSSLPASFFASGQGSAVIQALLQARAARTPRSENNRAEATEVLSGLSKIQDAVSTLLASEEMGLVYEGVPLTPFHFLEKVLSRCPHAAAAPPPLGGSPSLSASASSQPATQGGGGSFKEA